MQKIYLHPLPVRVWHWINATSFLILIITGLQIRYSDIMHLMSFRTAVDIHNIFGFVLLFNYLLWVLYYVLSSKFDIYMPTWDIREFSKGSIRQARYYLYGIFRGEPNPHHPTSESKFNPLQQVAYLNIMTILLPLQIVTGFMMLWSENIFAKWIAFFGGIRVVDSIHVLLFLFFTSFLFVHVYLATLGRTPLAHIKAMFIGYEEYEEEESSHAHH
jgi:Ni/Fe-hydrogenase b-type cytochrome subunit